MVISWGSMGVCYWSSDFGDWGSISQRSGMMVSVSVSWCSVCWCGVSDWGSYFGDSWGSNYGLSDWDGKRFTVDDGVESVDWVSGVFDGSPGAVGFGEGV